jgi:hypothetical protein
MAMEKSKSTPAARASKKIVLPDPRYREWTHFDLLSYCINHLAWSCNFDIYDEIFTITPVY